MVHLNLVGLSVYKVLKSVEGLGFRAKFRDSRFCRRGLWHFYD